MTEIHGDGLSPRRETPGSGGRAYRSSAPPRQLPTRLRIADTPRVFGHLDQWLRRRLRQARWKEWKRIRTRWRFLEALGIPRRQAARWAMSGKGPWRIAGSPILQRALPNPYWRDMGLIALSTACRHMRAA